MDSVNVYVGWDSREAVAFDVCKHSILERSSIDVNVIPLKQKDLRATNLYWRGEDIGSTEFTITRFLVPYLNGYRGPALFCDCDFLFDCDIAELFDLYDESKAVQVVKHDYAPPEKKKFLDNIQYHYPRKNWSSLVLWNTGHELNQQMTLNMVNSKEPSFLHQFKWLPDEMIGELGHEWNWLEGHYHEPEDGSPKVIHYTRGGPWFPGYENVDYADRWNKELKDYKENLK